MQPKIPNENPLRYNVFENMLYKENIKLEIRTDYDPPD